MCMNYRLIFYIALFLPILLSAKNIENANRALEKTGLKYCPALSDAKPSNITFKNLPTGAKDFEVMLPSPKNDIVVNASDFGLNENITNSATIINKAIAHCKKIGASKLVINKGTYKCFDAVSILIDDMQDFTLDCNGAKLIYYSPCIKAKNPVPAWNTAQNKSNCNLKIKNSRRIKVCNLQFDWDWENNPIGAFAKVVGFDKNANEPYIDFQFWQYEKYPFYNKYTPVVSVASFTDDLTAFHHARSGLFFPAPKPIHLAEGYYTSKTSWVSPNVMRLYVERKIAGNLPVGAVYRIMHYYVGKNCIDMYSNQHLTLENIDILSCRGHALHVDDGQQYWQYINVNVAPPKDDARRACSSSADHHHIANSRGFMKLIGCTFSMGVDDGANIHDRAFFMKRKSDYILESNNARGLIYFNPKLNDVLELYQADYTPTGYKGKIVKIDGETLHLDKPLPMQSKDGFVCFNTKYGTRNIIIKDCKYIRHGCRGLLLPAKDITVENCIFEREQMGAIKCETGYTKDLWCEGYGVDNIVVRNCTFRKSNIRRLKSQGFVRDIMLAAYLKTDPSDAQPAVPIIKNLLFENNKFFDTQGLVAIISSSNNVIFRNNVIENDFDYENNLWYRGGFCVRNSKDIYIIDNTYIESKKVPLAGVYYQQESVENLVARGNKIISKK